MTVMILINPFLSLNSFLNSQSIDFNSEQSLCFCVFPILVDTVTHTGSHNDSVLVTNNENHSRPLSIIVTSTVLWPRNLKVSERKLELPPPCSNEVPISTHVCQHSYNTCSQWWEFNHMKQEQSTNSEAHFFETNKKKSFKFYLYFYQILIMDASHMFNQQHKRSTHV